MKALVRSLPKALVAASMLCFAASSMAQWQWLDNGGRKVYSDRPPPAHIPQRNILKQPGGVVPVVVPVSNTATRPADKASAASQATAAAKPASSAAEQKEAAEAKKKEAEEAAKRKAEEEKVAKAKAENCQRARTALSTLKSGVRMATTNTKGEPVVMDDKARAAEEQHLNQAIANSCS